MTTIGICFLVNMLTTPSLQWWVIPAFAIGCGLIFDWMDERDGSSRTRVAEPAPVAEPPPIPAAGLPSTAAEAARRERAEAEAASVFGAVHLKEVRRLRAAVEDLHSRLSSQQRQLLGRVQEPVESLESRVQALVHQGRQVDAELRIHDDERLAREIEEARDRVEAAGSSAAVKEEQAALAVLERQRETLERVREQRSRIDARLRRAVGMMRALHLDLVECLSTDLEGSGDTLRRLGEQVRSVSQSVDALASAVDEVFFDGLPQPEGEAADAKAQPRRRRSRSS